MLREKRRKRNEGRGGEREGREGI